MVTLARYKTWVVLVGFTALMGCTNWEAIERAQTRELQAIEAFHKLISDAVQRPSGNAGEQAWIVYETRMAAFQGRMENLMPNTYGQTLQYASSQQDRQLQWASLGSSWLQFGIREWRDAARDYGSKVVFNANRKAKGKRGGDGSVSASGTTTFSNIYITQGRSQSAFDSNDLALGKDAQYQSGAGIQGQAFSDPPNFQQTEESISLDSSFGPSAGF